MVDLRQKELSDWQHKQFLPEDITLSNMALGVAEEAGEFVHAVLKHKQKIRGYEDEEFFKKELADAFGDIMIYGTQALSICGIDAEEAVKTTIETILKRKWKEKE